ncbi:MAG: 4Fe-4S dicluster domain-containing protein [Candidatus Tectomicrobia bacterium]|nr:4Fe-4S dicluster domain-containing protein [Candidatus Tectomicrobia bacterium]
MVIDIDKCTGCQACVLACKAENNIPAVSREESARGRSISWMRILHEVEGEYPDVRLRFIPRPCMHCDNPPCTKVCPVMATYKDRDGIVAQIYPRCIGCRFCMAACPYTVKYFNWHTYEMPNLQQRMHNPDVSVRTKGVVEKCTFCHHRLQRAHDEARRQGRPLEAGSYTTACSQTCPTGAIRFGDLDDRDSEVARLAKSPRAFRLLAELGTQPKVIYLTERDRHAT